MARCGLIHLMFFLRVYAVRSFSSVVDDEAAAAAGSSEVAAAAAVFFLRFFRFLFLLGWCAVPFEEDEAGDGAAPTVPPTSPFSSRMASRVRLRISFSFRRSNVTALMLGVRLVVRRAAWSSCLRSTPLAT